MILRNAILKIHAAEKAILLVVGAAHQMNGSVMSEEIVNHLKRLLITEEWLINVVLGLSSPNWM